MTDFLIYSFATLLIIVALLFIYIKYQTRYAVERKVEIKVKKTKNPIKITHITDFHSNTLKNLDAFLNKIRQFDPDFIVLTGDINDYGIKEKFDKAVYLLEKLSTLNKNIYYVTGNHEERGGMLDEFLFELKRNGIKHLSNNAEIIRVGKTDVYLYGCSFYDFNYMNFKPPESTLNVVLSHFSKKVRDNADGREDIVLSGHTHGGQVRFPIIGALYAPNEGFFPEFDRGLFKINDTFYYIDSGLGNTKWNLRFLCPIQFSNITIMCQ